MLNDFSTTANINKFKWKNLRGKSSNFVFKQRIFYYFFLLFCFRFRYQFKRFNLVVTFPVKADLKRLKFRLLKYSDFVMLKYNIFSPKSEHLFASSFVAFKQYKSFKFPTYTEARNEKQRWFLADSFWVPPIVIADNVIIKLMWSIFFKGPKASVAISSLFG